VLEEGSVATTKKAMLQTFGARPRCRTVIEVGTHSPWVGRLLSRPGHEVVVANARQVNLISRSSRKDDRMDAHTLARLARVDPQLLRPIRHRSEEAQQDLMEIRVRAALVDARTKLVNAARGLANQWVIGCRPATPTTWGRPSWRGCRRACSTACGRCWSKWKC